MSNHNCKTKRIQICGTDISAFSIALSQDAPEAERFAADELHRYVEAATGFSLPFDQNGAHRITVGPEGADTSEIRYDGFIVETDGGSLRLFGAMPRGTLYAVYEFAEKYVGFRQYEPGVERLLPGDVEIPAFFRDVQNPAFEFRATDWLTHVRGGPFAAWERMNSHRTGKMEGLGGTIETLGGCHTFERLCPPEEYFESNPEYYSLVNGERIPGGNKFDKRYGQLCLTNPDVLRIVTENVMKQLEGHDETVIVDVSQNDNGNYCQCDACRAVDEEEGGPSGTLLRFVNAVADAVKKVHPNALVQTFAYQYTRKPPKLTKPADNVIIRLCSIEACFRHALDDGSCELNRAFADDMAGWRAICDKISVWNYNTNYDCYYSPFPNIGILLKNSRYFADNHVIHMFEEDAGGTPTGEFGPLRAYLLSRTMWNPYMTDAEYDAHIKDFLEGYFGPGWRNIWEYLHILMETTKDRHFGCFMPLFPYPFTDVHETYMEMRMSYEPAAYQALLEEHELSEFFTHMPKLLRLWREALAKAPDNATRFRLVRAMMSLDYIELFCTPHDKASMTPEEQAAYEARCSEFLWKQELFGQYTSANTALRKQGQA